MNVQLAKSAGFCFGVNRAVNIVLENVKNGVLTATLGPIIHNRHVVEYLEFLGVKECDNIDSVPDGYTIILRSHGISKKIQDQLESRGLPFVDATCPNVKKIHRLVMEAEEEGRIPLIFGARSHPEIQAILGWTRNGIVLESPEELIAWLRAEPARRDLPIAAVCQTTSTELFWNSCTKQLKKECTNAKIFDTICYATEVRQKEAQELAGVSDLMVVVGDAGSSNTRRLAEICRSRCDRVVFVDDADELSMVSVHSVRSIGITAGASTPAWIIKEVYNQMNEEIKNELIEEIATQVADEVPAEVLPESEPVITSELNQNEDNSAESADESFEALLEQSLKTLTNGDRVKGTVTGISGTEIYVDLGAKHAGYIPFSEVSDDPTVKPEELFHVGDEVEVIVVRVNDGEGTAMLSKKRLDATRNWDLIEQAKDDQTVLEGTVTEENKGGVVAMVSGIRVFIPASQTGIPRNGDMSQLVHQNVKLRVTEVNRSRRRVVGSIRSVTSEARKAAQAKIWEEIEIGKKYQGVVKSLTSYGAFVDIGGVDGMVHVSELSWNRIKNPAEVVSVGDEIEVFVIGFDPEKKKISLGYKTDETNPWTVFTTNYQIGDVVPVKIVKLMTFGAFAEIIDGVDGLIHISQIADRRVEKPGDELSEGQELDAKIIGIDEERKRISLSVRALLSASEE